MVCRDDKVLGNVLGRSRWTNRTRRIDVLVVGSRWSRNGERNIVLFRNDVVGRAVAARLLGRNVIGGFGRVLQAGMIGHRGYRHTLGTVTQLTRHVIHPSHQIFVATPNLFRPPLQHVEEVAMVSDVGAMTVEPLSKLMKLFGLLLEAGVDKLIPLSIEVLPILEELIQSHIPRLQLRHQHVEIAVGHCQLVTNRVQLSFKAISLIKMKQVNQGS